MSKMFDSVIRKFFISEKIGEYSLKNIEKACEHFGNPQDAFKSIHIAGTNGKGSTSKMIFQILKESGKRVGVYTSPHMSDIRERFETQSELITEQAFIRLARKILAYNGNLSYFERCVMLAFLYFKERGCEYAVIEVGMGGRLDATNIITPILSIITSISYDHVEYLGNTLEKIAYEKGGIIKPGIPVILYDKNPTLEEIAKMRNSQVIYSQKRTIYTNLLGEHQISNALIAYEAGRFLGISEEIIEHALVNVSHPGRLQYLKSNLLIDGAHNEDGIKKLRNYLENEGDKWEEILYFVNIKQGKKAQLFVDIFPEVHTWNIIDSSGFQVTQADFLAGELIKLKKNQR